MTYYKITQKEEDILHTVCKKFGFYNQVTKTSHNKSELFKLIYLFLFKQHKISYNNQVSWSRDLYLFLEKVYQTNITWVDENTAGDLVLIVRTDKAFEMCTQRLKEKLELKYGVSILHCFLRGIEEYLK